MTKHVSYENSFNFAFKCKKKFCRNVEILCHFFYFIVIDEIIELNEKDDFLPLDQSTSNTVAVNLPKENLGSQSENENSEPGEVADPNSGTLTEIQLTKSLNQLFDCPPLNESHSESSDENETQSNYSLI